MRNDRLDALKLGLAACVVFVRFAPNTPGAEFVSASLLVFAVPTFILLSLYFATRSLLGSSAAASPITVLRVQRILVPYFAWTVTYLLLRLIKHHFQTATVPIDWVGALLYGGTGIQMWFLPFLLLCEAWLVAFMFVIRKPRRYVAAVVTVALALTYCWYGRPKFAFGDAVIQAWLYLIAAFLLRIDVNSTSLPVVRHVRNFGLAAIALTMGLRAPTSMVGAVLAGPIAGFAVASTSFALVARTYESKWVSWLLTCSYGIFLSHQVFTQALVLVATKLAISLTPYGTVEKMILVVLTVICCCALISLLRRNTLLRYIFLGEAGVTPLALPTFRKYPVSVVRTH